MKRNALALGVTFFTLALALWPIANAQEQPTHISGRVVNGTAGAGAMEGMEVTLHVFRGGELLDTRTIAPDPDGQFAFQDVPHQGSLFYVLTTTYLDIPYSVDLRPDSDLEDVRLTVYESAGSLEAVSLVSDSLFILAADRALRILSALEVIQVVNQGDRVFVANLANGEAMAFLRFPLPPGAINLEVETELPQGEVLQVDRGFALTTPVPPGEHGIALTYTVPYSGRELDLSRSFVLGAGMFRLLVPEEVGSVITESLEDLDTVAIGDTVYRVFGAGEIGRGERVEIILGDLAQPSLWQRFLGRLSLGSWVTAAIPVTFTLVVTLLLVTALLRGTRAVRTEEGETLESIPEDRPAMIRAMAALDDRFQRGEMEEAEYQQRRYKLKARLLRPRWEEEVV